MKTIQFRISIVFVHVHLNVETALFPPIQFSIGTKSEQFYFKVSLV